MRPKIFLIAILIIMIAGALHGEAGTVQEEKTDGGHRDHSALDPDISFGGDYYFSYGSSESDYNRLPSEFGEGTGKLSLREMELGLESSLDPSTMGKAYISFGHEGAALEEGYLVWLAGPLNMNLKLGKFKNSYGIMNRYHTHDMPQFDRPFMISNFFTKETLKGVGVGANFQLPSITARVNELDLEVVSCCDGLSFTSEGKHNILYVAHLKNHWGLNESTNAELGFSGAYGYNDSAEKYRTAIVGADLRMRWQPHGKEECRGAEWWTEALFSRREEFEENIESWGLFSLLRIRLGARWHCGCRFDYSQMYNDSSAEEFGGSLAIDFQQSESVLLRLQYTRVERNFDEDDDRLILQTNWSMGPHDHKDE